MHCAGANGRWALTHLAIAGSGMRRDKWSPVGRIAKARQRRKRADREGLSLRRIVQHQSAGMGSRVSKMDLSGQLSFSFLKSSVKQLRPQVDQRVTSSTTLER